MAKRSREDHQTGKGELLYAARYHGFMKDLVDEAPYGVTIASMDPHADPPSAADFIWRAFSSRTETHVLWAHDHRDMWEPDVFARRVAEATEEIVDRAATAEVYILIMRTKATSQAYSERQREVIPLASCQQIVPVADEDDVIDCMKLVVSKGLGYAGGPVGNKKGKSKKNSPTRPPDRRKGADRSYDDRAADALEKAINGLGKKSARRLLTECGSFKALADEGGAAIQQRKFNANIASGVRAFMDARL